MLTTLHYLRTLVFGIPLCSPRDIYDLMSVLGLRPSFIGVASSHQHHGTVTALLP